MDGLREFLVSASRGGGRNFRSLGGFLAGDGRRVVPGRVYRSGHLGELAEPVRSEFRNLQVRTVVTFQTQQEIEILGDPLPRVFSAAAWEHIPIGDRWFQQGVSLPTDMTSQGAFYVAMVRDHADLWVRFLRVFARSDSFPVLYHCTAGRDRTGVATVLLLESLGVRRRDTVADYLVSNEVFQENVQDETVLDPLFAAIDQAGGIEEFLELLGLAREELEAVRANLLGDVV
jgi:protein-tyrosine phosphatase